jgi:hypothetical protein
MADAWRALYRLGLCASRCAVTIIDALDSPQLFAPAFGEADWSSWKAFLTAVSGLPMAPALRKTRLGRVGYASSTAARSTRTTR